MKKILSVIALMLSITTFAQNKTDDARMQRDIEVAENILSTLIKQELGKRNFFPLEVEGSYLPGYGVTFHVPSNYFGNVFFFDENDGTMNIDFVSPPEPVAPVAPGEPVRPVKSYSRSYNSNDDQQTQQIKRNTARSKTKAAIRNNSNDSTKEIRIQNYNDNLLEAAKNFIADYGDLLTQLQPNEKIVITNRGEGDANMRMMWAGFNVKQNVNVISVEGLKSDVNQFRQGKTTREQLMNKIKTVNTEANDEVQPDLELLSSIFNRLYDRDLSKTFYSDGNIYYERLNDFGAIYHIQVYASNLLGTSFDNVAYYDMPTLHITDVDQATRDKKVKEIYPEFEKSIKEDFLEYGRTIKSLKDNESLIFEIAMTRCNGCNIPSTLELSIKNSVLKDYASGKISKEAALAKINVKQGANQ